MQNLSIYIHIPFCRQKCLYCDFLSAPADEAMREAYIQALCEEICAEAKYYKKNQVVTVFLGGGTPSLLSGEQIARIFACLREHYVIIPDAEITMEMNPGTVTAEKLEQYLRAGVNRVSLGLQSADNTELRELGRIHTWEMFLDTYELCRQRGIRNINVDLMSALPGQTLVSYKRTLEKVAELEPEHISAYSLIIEEGTPFYERYGEAVGKKQPFRQVNAAAGQLLSLPDEDTERQMYEQTKAFLETKGYHRYEISNYAKSGMECRHNCVYWKRDNYAGFGLGAASMVNNVRWSNVDDLKQYIALPGTEKKAEKQMLSISEQMEETMFLGLRMMKGVSESAFAEKYGRTLKEVYGEVIKKHVAQGLLVDDKYLRLTDKGIDVSNYILADFLL